METSNIGKKMKNNLAVWKGPEGANIPARISSVDKIIKYAKFLSENQQHQIANAFSAGAYDMAAEYAWKRAMTKLKETIATLGMKFIGEILGRDDIDDFTPVDNVLTDFATIDLAEQLGVVGSTAAIKLRQSQELISHFFSGKADEDIDEISAVGIVRSSVQYILAEQDISIAIEFTQLKERLLSETIQLKDMQIAQLIESPLFYLRTVITVLLSSIKKDKGASLEHALGNLNFLIPHIWPQLGENDKWNIGSAYRDVVAAGNTISAKGLKNALLKVSGFDYVPENLRSSTFKKAARLVIATHYEMNNFYNEPRIVRFLSNLGSVIPAPALIECMQAYLIVYIGNSFGFSHEAAPIALEGLKRISEERWYYYFQKVINSDNIILGSLSSTSQVLRFKGLLNELGYDSFIDLPEENQKLYEYIVKGETVKAKASAYKLYMRIQN